MGSGTDHLQAYRDLQLPVFYSPWVEHAPSKSQQSHSTSATSLLASSAGSVESVNGMCCLKLRNSLAYVQYSTRSWVRQMSYASHRTNC